MSGAEWVALMTVAVGVFSSPAMLARQANRAKARDEQAKARLIQIHTLVNSTMTVTLQQLLEARELIIVLLKEADERSSTPAGRERITLAEAKTDELRKRIDERMTQASAANSIDVTAAGT